MQKLVTIIGAILFGAVTCVSNSFAGEKEDVVLSGCAVTASTAVGYAACVGAGLTGNEINTCVNDPQRCYGPNNELRKMFCAVGIGGCPKPPTPAQLIRVLPFRGGCIAIFDNGMYWSPDCQHLREEAPPTQNAWQVAEPYYKYVQGMVILNNCVITAFSGGGIYKSCNGLNIGGGGETAKLYQGTKVYIMKVINYRGKPALATVFGDAEHNTQYCDPSGNYPAGNGPGVTHCEP